jgi:octaprenyl-diphosphate synthase
MSAPAALRHAPGLDAYLGALEERLDNAIAAHPGTVARVGAEALAAGGKRLRPLLVFLSARRDQEPPLAEGVAVELVHLASLLHDDIIDGAEVRRGRAAAWSQFGPGAARAAGDYLFARAFAELAATGDIEAVEILSDTALCLARGEALQWSQQHDPDTSIAAYLDRCALKTGKLFEAACLLGSRDPELGRFGLALGIAFQIVDDILDCAGITIETGKIAGTDLRDGIPTLPLILAAREDEVVRQALAGGPTDGALLRVGATGALDRSRELALDYARKARACLDGRALSEELEALTHMVVNRER